MFNSKKQNIGDNSSNNTQVYVENLIINNITDSERCKSLNQGDQKKISIIYSSLYEWHVKNGIKNYLNEYGEDEDFQEYSKLIQSLNTPENVKSSEVINISREQISGILTWAGRFIIDGKKLKNHAKEIEKVLSVATDRIINDIKNDTRRKIVENELIKQEPALGTISQTPKLGGLIFLTQTMATYDPSAIIKIDALGFEKIVSKKSLVNLAINKKIEILSVKLNHDKPEFSVNLAIKNLTKNIVSFEIPKGQVFENDKMGQTRQNLISSHHFEGDYYTLNPEEEKYIEIPAYCLNEDQLPPNGGKGNITFYCVKEKAFVGQNDFWEQRKKLLKKFGKEEYSKV